MLNYLSHKQMYVYVKRYLLKSVAVTNIPPPFRPCPYRHPLPTFHYFQHFNISAMQHFSISTFNSSTFEHVNMLPAQARAALGDQLTQWARQARMFDNSNNTNHIYFFLFQKIQNSAIKYSWVFKRSAIQKFTQSSMFQLQISKLTNIYKK